MKFVRVLSLTTAVAVTVYSSIGGAACEISPGFEGLNTTVKGYPIPRIQPVQGVDYVNVEQVAKLVDNPSYVFIDVRPAGFFKVCRLNGSTNLEYTFAGPGGEAMYKKGPRLTKQVLEAYLQDKKTVVLFCNNAFNKTGCHRAANAAITAVCSWNLPAEGIKWFGDGVPGTVAQQPELTSGDLCRKPWH